MAGGRTLWMHLGVGVDHMLPGSRARLGVDTSYVGHSDPEGSVRGFRSFAVGLEESLGFLAILGFEAGLAASDGVLDVEGSVGALTEEAVSLGGGFRLHADSEFAVLAGGPLTRSRRQLAEGVGR